MASSMSNSNMNVYKLTKAVADVILSIDDAVIFGGYVRDHIRHNHMAQKFYAHETTAGVGIDKLGVLYDSPFVLPEYKDRTLVASDIDCFMCTSDITRLEDKLKEQNLKVFTKRERKMSEYMVGVSEPDLELTHIVVGFDISPILKTILPSDITSMRVKIDIVNSVSIKGKEPPFGEIDFECNALIIDSNKQIRVSNRLFKNNETYYDPFARFTCLQEIIQNIYEKKTRVVAHGGADIAQHRMEKMTSKGYIIVGRDDKFSIAKGAAAKDDVCLMCLDKFKKNAAMVKRVCCAAKYHKQCIAEMVNHDNFNGCCPMCRNEIDCLEIEHNKMLWS
jgi:hypothetical protein